MPSKVRQTPMKPISKMRYDERENLVMVMGAMSMLYSQKTPQTTRAIYDCLGGQVAEKTIVRYRLWLAHHKIVKAPKDFEHPSRWDGRNDLLFSLRLECVPFELWNTRASDHVIRKQIDKAIKAGIVVEHEGKLKFKAAAFLSKVKGYKSDDYFLNALTRLTHKQVDPRYHNIWVTDEMFISELEGGLIEIDYEEYRYPFRRLIPLAHKQIQMQQKWRLIARAYILRHFITIYLIHFYVQCYLHQPSHLPLIQLLILLTLYRPYAGKNNDDGEALP